MNRVRYSLKQLENILSSQPYVKIAAELKYKSGVVIFQKGTLVNRQMLEELLSEDRSLESNYIEVEPEKKVKKKSAEEQRRSEIKVSVETLAYINNEIKSSLHELTLKSGVSDPLEFMNSLPENYGRFLMDKMGPMVSRISDQIIGGDFPLLSESMENLNIEPGHQAEGFLVGLQACELLNATADRASAEDLHNLFLASMFRRFALHTVPYDKDHLLRYASSDYHKLSASLLDRLKFPEDVVRIVRSHKNFYPNSEYVRLKDNRIVLDSLLIGEDAGKLAELTGSSDMKNVDYFPLRMSNVLHITDSYSAGCDIHFAGIKHDPQEVLKRIAAKKGATGLLLRFMEIVDQYIPGVLLDVTFQTEESSAYLKAYQYPCLRGVVIDSSVVGTEGTHVLFFREGNNLLKASSTRHELQLFEKYAGKAKLFNIRHSKFHGVDVKTFGIVSQDEYDKVMQAYLR